MLAFIQTFFSSFFSFSATQTTWHMQAHLQTQPCHCWPRQQACTSLRKRVIRLVLCYVKCSRLSDICTCTALHCTCITSDHHLAQTAPLRYKHTPTRQAAAGGAMTARMSAPRHLKDLT